MYCRLDAIIDVTEAYTYHGFLPSLVRKCILHMVEADLAPFPQAFSTALFSFLYHLASYESGGDALLSCGVMPSLLHLVSWPSDDQDHITVCIFLTVYFLVYMIGGRQLIVLFYSL